MRLGDTAVNSANHTERHNDGLHAVFAAARAITSAEAPAGSLALCDRGDGSAAGKQSARLAHAHINATHVPDFVRFAARPHCYEWKCVTPFLTSAQSLGRGSRAHGGSASTSDGGRFAMGNTEEALAVKTLGIMHSRGSPSDGPFSRLTGSGWVAATSAHDYVDAQRRGNGVTLLVSEVLGGLSPSTIKFLRALAAAARAPSATDSTVYGQSRASPRHHYTHHLAAISSAIVAADARIILNHAAHASYMLSVGLHD
jgi:hypothetical protein